MADEFDVAVVGAGPAGSATARRLARSGCRVVLLEQSRFDAPRVGESLAPSTNALLTELGVWPRFTGLCALLHKRAKAGAQCERRGESAQWRLPLMMSLISPSTPPCRVPAGGGVPGCSILVRASRAA